MTAFTYVLRSEKDGGIYIGSTRNLKLRIKEHKYGHVRSTKGRRPMILIYSEDFESYTDALKRENYLKSGVGRDWLKNRHII
jgi:putative endonuclease